MTSRSAPPAITPDIRATNNGINTTNNKISSTTTAASDSSKKVVSFGLFHSSKSPNSETRSKMATKVTKEEAMRQYKLYRSSPSSFPSYDRIILVKLPREYLPASLTTTHQGCASAIANTDDFYWPALLYNNLVEVVRDLSPNETQMLKAQLIVEYKKYPTRRVARLIGWKNGIIDDHDCNNDKNGKSKSNKGKEKKDIILFAESKLELLRLPCTNNIEEMMENETKNFCISLTEMEKMYCHLLELAATKESKIKSNKNYMEKNAVKQFAIRFGYALDMAMNCLSSDVGSEPLLPRIYEENYQEDELPPEMMMTMTEHDEKRNHVCKTPNSIMAANDGRSDKNGARTTHGNKKHSPAEESMFSTAAVANGDDYNSGVSGQPKSTKNSAITKGAKRKIETNDEQHRTNEMNKGDDDAKAMTKKTVRPITTTVARGGAVVGRSKPPVDKACMEATIAVAPVTTKSVKVKAPEEDMTKEIIPWKDVWATMKRCGWTWKGGSGLMTDYYYIKPKCKVQGGVSGVDYFVSVGDTMEFARRTYGWDEHGVSSLTRKQLFSLIEEHAEYAGEVVPPLAAEMALSPNGPWRDAWKVMLRSGWTWRTGSGLMLDYYYIKPGCKVGGGVEGQDYFVRVEDVQKFARRNYGWIGPTSGDSGVVHDTEDCGATKAKKRRLSSSGGSGENTSHVPMLNLPKVEAIKPATKESVNVDAATKRMRAAKAKSELQESTEEDDDDTVDEEDETRSTFSQSVFQSKKLFSDECADEIIPPLVVDKLGDETWSKAWKKMRDSGWSWKGGTGLMTDYYYIKPGCKVKGGVVGRDYFILTEDVQRFAMRNYGWSGRKFTDDNERKRSNSAVNNIPSIEKLRCDEVGDASRNHQQIVSYSMSKAEPSMPPSNQYEKKALWQKLQRKGWKAIRAGRYNKLHDWYYVRPHCDPGDSENKLGVDFFLCEEDAIEAAKKYGDKEGLEVNDDEAGQQEQVLKEAISPIRSARKGTPAGPLPTPQDRRTRPQDPAIPLLSSPESCSSAARYDMYEWHNLWPFLERTGWRCIKAGKYNPLHNYYYVRPNRDPGDKVCVFGKHYFDSKDDVISHVKGTDDERGRRGKRDACRKSMGVMLDAFDEVAND